MAPFRLFGSEIVEGNAGKVLHRRHQAAVDPRFLYRRMGEKDQDLGMGVTGHR
jgi:hypothetical protein